MPRLHIYLLVWLAAGCGEPMEVGSAESPIVNGVVDHGHPAVGILVSGGGHTCTATLVERDKVLTAAHCVTSDNLPFRLLLPVRFYLGGYYGIEHDAASVSPHPDFAGGSRSDIAVVMLEKGVSDVEPLPIASSTPVAGERVMLVGYGLAGGSSSGQFGTKRKAENVVGKVNPLTFELFGSSGQVGNICDGDSGGPALAVRNGHHKEVVLGVHTTKHGTCGHAGTDMRVDAYRRWIDAQEVTKMGYGWACASGQDCSSGLCLDLLNEQETFCTRRCRDDQPCSGGDRCVLAGATEQICLPNVGGEWFARDTPYTCGNIVGGSVSCRASERPEGCALGSLTSSSSPSQDRVLGLGLLVVLLLAAIRARTGYKGTKR